jgi:hypothetical protein
MKSTPISTFIHFRTFINDHKIHLLGCYHFELSHTAINSSTFLNTCFEEWGITNKVYFYENRIKFLYNHIT